MTPSHAPWPRILLAALLPLAFAACQRDKDAAAPAATPATATGNVPTAPAATGQANREFPSLRVTTLDGKDWDLAQHRGRWVVVNFWATWCGPCLKEMPDLSALDSMREHVEVIGLAYEDIEPAALRSFLEQHPVVYPIAIVDVYDPPADFESPRGLPMTYLLAPDGKVARHFLGPVTAAEIDAAIAAAGGPATG